MLRTCCFCLSLQVGCYIVAGYFLIVQCISIYSYASLLPFLEPDEREDEENKEIRERAKTKHIVWIVLTVLFCFIGVFIVVATYLERPLLLKVSAGLLLVPSLIVILRLPFEGRPPNVVTLFSSFISLAIFIYCAVILWSFAKEIEDPDVELAVYVDPSYYRDYQQGMTDRDQQFTPYPSQQQLQNRGQAYYPYPQSNQPYGNRNMQGYPYQGVPYYYQPQPNYYNNPGHPNLQSPNQPRQQ